MFGGGEDLFTRRKREAAAGGTVPFFSPFAILCAITLVALALCPFAAAAAALARQFATDALGINAEFVEATAFAWLARETLASRPGNLPAVTGARGPRILGGIYPA